MYGGREGGVRLLSYAVNVTPPSPHSSPSPLCSLSSPSVPAFLLPPSPINSKVMNMMMMSLRLMLMLMMMVVMILVGDV